MFFREILENKKDYLSLLLLGDEQESMIDRYLEDGRMFVLLDGEVKAVFVLSELNDSTIELKNIAVEPRYQGQGLGRKCLEFIASLYRNSGKTLIVGTGESPLTMGFYKHCGFAYSHRVEDFFTQNYDHPIVEDGRILKDMIYFSKKF